MEPQESGQHHRPLLIDISEPETYTVQADPVSPTYNQQQQPAWEVPRPFLSLSAMEPQESGQHDRPGLQIPLLIDISEPETYTVQTDPVSPTYNQQQQPAWEVPRPFLSLAAMEPRESGQHDRPGLQIPLLIDISEPETYTVQTDPVSPTSISDEDAQPTVEELVREIHQVDWQIAQTKNSLTQLYEKIRLHETPDLNQPGTHAVHVEPFSPISDANTWATKEDLVTEIRKVDREIAQTQHRLAQLNARKQEFEEASEAQIVEDRTENIAPAKCSLLGQQIYAANMKKAAEAHSVLSRLGPPVEVPLYNQPSDTPNCQEAMLRHAKFKPLLVAHLRRKFEERRAREQAFTSKFNELSLEFTRKCEEIEGSAKRKAKDAKRRVIFEKTFPELRKLREDKERLNRLRARVRSDGDMEEVIDGLKEQEMEEKRMRSNAVIPPMMLDPELRKHSYINNNGRIPDLAKEFEDATFINCWTPQEHEIFKETYLQHPKNFSLIASYIEKKSVSDCVQHYYLTKHHEKYKVQLEELRQGRTGASSNPASANYLRPLL